MIRYMALYSLLLTPSGKKAQKLHLYSYQNYFNIRGASKIIQQINEETKSMAIYDSVCSDVSNQRDIRS
jgi:hypothetical protein